MVTELEFVVNELVCCGGSFVVNELVWCGGSFVVNELGWPSNRVLLMGRSIGTGVSTHLAANHPVMTAASVGWW